MKCLDKIKIIKILKLIFTLEVVIKLVASSLGHGLGYYSLEHYYKSFFSTTKIILIKTSFAVASGLLEITLPYGSTPCGFFPRH
jgi:hypothetical protein